VTAQDTATARKAELARPSLLQRGGVLVLELESHQARDRIAVVVKPLTCLCSCARLAS